jgi:hypothetical protein
MATLCISVPSLRISVFQQTWAEWLHLLFIHLLFKTRILSRTKSRAIPRCFSTYTVKSTLMQIFLNIFLKCET